MKNIRTKFFIIVPLLSLLVLFFQNCQTHHSTLESFDLSSNSNSAEVFAKTLHPVLVKKCSECHGDDQAPLFAVENSSAAHQAMLIYGLVSFDDPSSSKMLLQIKKGHTKITEGKNEFPPELSAELEVVIKDWLSQVVYYTDDDDDLVLAFDPTFTNINEKIFTPKCIECHSSGGSHSEVDYASYFATLRTGQIIPGDGSKSGLFMVFNRSQGHVNSVSILPEELNSIKVWINHGALDN